MEKEEKIKTLPEKIFNALIEGDNSSYDDFACAITYPVFVVDNLIHRKYNTKSGAFTKYIYNLIGEVCNLKKED